MSKKKLTYMHLFILISLLSLTFLTIMYPVTLPLGITISLTSIFSLLTLLLFKPSIGIPAIIFVHFISLVRFQAPIEIVLPLAEIFFISIMIYYVKTKRHFVFWGVIFWIFIGTPLSLWIYYSYYDLSFENVLLFSLSKDLFNGVLNFLIADMLIAYIPFKRLLGNHPYQSVTIKRLLLHLSITAMVVPFIIFVSVNSYQSIGSMEDTVIQTAENQLSEVKQTLLQWSEEDQNKLVLYDIIQLGRLDERLKQTSTTDGAHITITTKSGLTLGTTDQTVQTKEPFIWRETNNVIQKNELYQVISTDSSLDIINWQKGTYTYTNTIDETGLEMIIQIPIGIYQKQFIGDFLNQFIFLLFFILAAIFFTFSMQKILVNTLNKLTDVTTGLPQKINDHEQIEWPQSSIQEISALVNNFKKTSVTLRQMFDETQIVNTQLKLKTEKLTESQVMLNELAFFDPLTNLPNRQNFQDSLTSMIQKAKQEEKELAILFLDVNQFKQINDTLGHLAGDELLKEIASELKSLITDSIQVYRLGGDEFVILVYDLASNNSLEALSDHLVQIFNVPFSIQGSILHISSSIGISIYPKDGTTKDTLIQNADIAMYCSKQESGTTIRYFEEHLRDNFTEQVHLTNEIRKAIAENEFELYYQPKVSTEQNEITSLEALIRWNTVNGSISPLHFIPIAEQSNLIKDIDKWVIMEACMQNKKWQEQGHKKVPVSVNISAKHFDDEQLIEIVRHALKTSNLEGKYLQIELTENVFINNFDKASMIMQELKKLDVLFSIDDFGKGYSSLNHLIHLPIDEVKLDKSFISNIDKEIKKAEVVKLVIDSAHTLGFTVVAEGVEYTCELNLLKTLGCDEVQGFLFSKPLPSEDLHTLFNAQSLMYKLGGHIE
ncbi:EAL domain-containing protein [Aquibacillus koreensis]|uniref:EAL domain-containing protein n=1 Tax=Aquibacillus koreensis TaxID=279446 RepID=A0A9X3WPU3_9BACI|nr:EAL domain-containing protein [Aquibacillus koreensis]MCT2537808.1 EAL domain-containing protein [Aquibacillus koreensis]MDC3421159.1 EAL domain-containing protein [Aquibacillus koreensis]